MAFSRSKKTKTTLTRLVCAFIVGFSLILGWGTAHAFNYAQLQENTKSVDKATGNFKIGKELYLQNCATCHIPIPPAVLPDATWKTILENPLNHYGTRVEGLTRFNQQLIWQYVKNYSRPLLRDEREPKFMAESRYFFALHPEVNFTSTVTHRSCIECHIKAQDFEFRVSYD